MLLTLTFCAVTLGLDGELCRTVQYPVAHEQQCLYITQLIEIDLLQASIEDYETRQYIKSSSCK